MIVKMKKATIIMYSPKKDENLKALKSAGMLHLTDIEGKGEYYDVAINDFKEVQLALDTIEKITEKPKPKPIKSSIESGIALAKHINKVYSSTSELKDKINLLNKEILNINFWGDFKPNDILSLSKKSVDILLYKIPLKKFKKIKDDFHYFQVAIDKTNIGIAIVNNNEISNILKGIDSYELPNRGISEINSEISILETKLISKQIELDSLIRDYGALVYVCDMVEDNLENIKYYTGSQLSDHKQLSVISGYIPETKTAQMELICKKSGIGYILSNVDPEDDEVPVLVKTNKLVSLITPVFNLLGTIPGYREYDISPFFLLFFLLFFAMIFGDAGYGMLLFTGSITGIFVSIFKGKKPNVAFVLLLCLSITTIIWGSITGAWFGSKTLVETTFLKKLVVDRLYAFNPDSANLVIYFSFTIGLTHLTIAHLWNFFRQLFERPIIKAFAQLGWLSMLYGLFFIVLNLLLGKVIPSVTLYLIGVGLTVVLIFSQQDGKFFVGLLKGFGGIITTFLDIIGMFSDIISYIRLFAVGLASLEIAKAFNSMAEGIAGADPSAISIVAAVVILFLGHSLNLILGALSVVVHGVRLNMLEFSGHLGMEWSGSLYDPFRDRKMVNFK